jgi:hypothetical protein
MAEDKKFRYQPRWLRTILAGLAFAGAAAFFAVRAKTNVQGLVVYQVLHFEPRGADIVYAVLAALSGGFVAVAIGALIHYRVPRYVSFEADAVVLPSSPLRASRRIPFEQIRSLRVWALSGEVQVTITHDGGRASLARSMLAPGEFEQVVEELRARSRHAS